MFTFNYTTNLTKLHNTNSTTRNEDVHWLLSTPPLLLALASLVSLFVVHRANKVDQRRILISDPLTMKKRSNDYFILSLLNALILSDAMVVLFVGANFFPCVFDTGSYSDSGCIVIAMGVQFITLYAFCWHLLLSCYLFGLLIDRNFRFRCKLSISPAIHKKTRKKQHKNYNYDDYNFNQMRHTFLMIQMVLILFCIICTAMPFKVYGSFYTYYDENGIGYGKQCWIKENSRFDLIVYVFGGITWCSQFCVLIFAIYKLYKVELNNKKANLHLSLHGQIASGSNTSNDKISSSKIKNGGNINNDDNHNYNTDADNESNASLISNKLNTLFRSNSAYKHLILQLSYWVVIYGMYCAICGTQRSLHLFFWFWNINSHAYKDYLFLAVMYNWGVVSIGLVDGMIWCLNKRALQKYTIKRLIENEKLMENKFYEYEKERYNAYQQIELAKQKENVYNDTTRTSELPDATITRFRSDVTSFYSGQMYRNSRQNDDYGPGTYTGHGHNYHDRDSTVYVHQSDGNIWSP